MTKTFNLAILALAPVLLGASAAHAHPSLTQTIPQADAIIAASPIEIRLSFSEGLFEKFSGIELKDQNGERVDTGPAAIDPQNAKKLVVPVNTTLAPGTYRVAWHAVSEDTHRIKGSYTFRVSQ